MGGWAMAAPLLLAYPPSRLHAQGGVVKYPGSARSAALAGAGVALVGDAGSMFANPAGLATIHDVALEGTYEPYSRGTSLTSGAGAVRLGRFDYGIAAQARRTRSPTPSTDVLALSTIVFRYGLIAVGGSVKYVRQGATAPQAQGWAGDAGVAIALFDIFALAASVQNLGGDLSAGVHLPRRTRVGLTLNYVDPQGPGRLLTTVEGQWTEGQPSVLVAGAEAGIVIRGLGFVARVGTTGQPSSSTLSPLALGAGIEVGRLRLDYAYRAFNVPAGATHRFGARWTP